MLVDVVPSAFPVPHSPHSLPPHGPPPRKIGHGHERSYLEKHTDRWYNYNDDRSVSRFGRRAGPGLFDYC